MKSRNIVGAACASLALASCLPLPAGILGVRSSATPGIAPSPSPSPQATRAARAQATSCYSVTTHAGAEAGHRDGPREQALFKRPNDLAFDDNGNLYVSDDTEHTIRKIASDGLVSTLAGNLDGFADGPGADARFRAPAGMAPDKGGTLFVADSGNSRIRKVVPDGTTTTLAGSRSGYKDGPLEEALFSNPTGIARDSLGNLYVADTGNNRIRVILPTGEVITTMGKDAGNADGTVSEARFSGPRSIAVHDDALYVVDEGNSAIRKAKGPYVTTIARISAAVSIGGNWLGAPRGGTWSRPTGLAVDRDGTVFVAAGLRVYRIPPGGSPESIAGFVDDWAPDFDQTSGDADGIGFKARFKGARSLALGPDGALYVGDLGNGRIRKITRKPDCG